MKTWTFTEARPKTSGRWDDEPDKAQWIDDATGLDCLIVRNRLGALCGYVGVPAGHPLHGVDYDRAYDHADIEVHGGLTFASPCQEGAGDGYGICHVPEPGRPDDVWWLGFDCAHAGDLVPGMDEVRSQIKLSRYERRDTYRDFDYVKSEVTGLAAQISAAAAR